MGFEPTCPCGQLHFECSSLQPLRYASVYKYSLLETNHMISSLLCNCDGDARLGAVSVSPVPAEGRLKSGFFARKALQDRLFLKVGSNRYFSDFGEKCGKIGEKNRETAIHRRIELPTDENLFLRCYKWMYFPSTGTAFPR